MYSGITNGLIQNNKEENPFNKWGQQLDMKNVLLPEVAIKANRVNSSTIRTDPENEKKAHEEIQIIGEKER